MTERFTIALSVAPVAFFRQLCFILHSLYILKQVKDMIVFLCPIRK